MNIPTSSTVPASVDCDTVEALRVAGFVRRGLAFALDILLLGIIGDVLGMLLSAWLVELGAWGRLFGYAVAGLYFGLLDSRATYGASIGKLVLGLRVVDQRGQMITPLRATLRYLPVGIPYFLYGASLPLAALHAPWLQLERALVCGLSLCAVYLLLCNRASRQCLHDVATHCWVVHRHGALLRVPWRGHYVVCALLLVCAAFAPAHLTDALHSQRADAASELQAALRGQPWVRKASVERSAVHWFGYGGAARVLKIEIEVVDRDLDALPRYEQAARTALLFSDEIDALDAISVTLYYGYDIGIADDQIARTQSRSISDWRALVGPAGYAI